jgi:hypothetical protein
MGALQGRGCPLGLSGFFFEVRFALFDFGLFNTRARAVGSGCITSPHEPQAQLLRHVLVDRAGVGLLLRDAQFRQ